VLWRRQLSGARFFCRQCLESSRHKTVPYRVRARSFYGHSGFVARRENHGGAGASTPIGEGGGLGRQKKGSGYQKADFDQATSS